MSSPATQPNKPSDHQASASVEPSPRPLGLSASGVVVTEHLRILRWQRALVALASAAAWTLSGLLLVGVLLVLADVFFAFADPARWWAWGVLMLAGLGLLADQLRPLFATRWDDFNLARWIEQRDRTWHERLSQTVAFLTGRSAEGHESLQLRHHLVQSTAQVLQGKSFFHLIDRHDLHRRLAVCIALLALVGLLAFASPSKAGLGLRRLLAPWRSLDWPPPTVLILADPPSDVLQATPWDISLKIKGDWPEMVELVVIPWTLPGKDADQRQMQRHHRRPTRTRDGQAQISVLAPTMSFLWAVKVPGYQTPWKFTRVWPKPQLIGVTQEVHAPEYLGRAAEPIPAGRRKIAAVVGSTLRATFEFDRPIQQAHWHGVDAQRRIVAQPLTLSKNRQSATGLWKITQSGLLKLSVTEPHGLKVADRQFPTLNLRAQPDRQPEVHWLNSPRELEVSPQGWLKLNLRATDDFGLRQIDLLHTLVTQESNVENAKTKNLWTLPKLSSRQGQRPLVKQLATAWSPKKANIKEGQTVRLWVQAFDDRQPALAGRGQSKSLMVKVVSAKSLQSTYRNQLSKIINELQELHKSQHIAQKTSAELSQRWQAGNWNQDDLNLFRQLDLGQRRVSDAITQPERGLAQKLSQLRQQFDRNRLTDSLLRRQLDHADREIDRLAQQTIPAINQALTQHRHQLENPNVTAADKKSQGLALASRHQKSLESNLQQLVQTLESWQRESQLVQRLEQIIQNQQMLRQEMMDLPDHLLGRSTQEWNSNDRQQIQQWHRHQREIRAQYQELRALAQAEAQADGILAQVSAPQLPALLLLPSGQGLDSTLELIDSAIAAGQWSQTWKHQRTVENQCQQLADQLRGWQAEISRFSRNTLSIMLDELKQWKSDFQERPLTDDEGRRLLDESFDQWLSHAVDKLRAMSAEPARRDVLALRSALRLYRQEAHAKSFEASPLLSPWAKVETSFAQQIGQWHAQWASRQRQRLALQLYSHCEQLRHWRDQLEQESPARSRRAQQLLAGQWAHRLERWSKKMLVLADQLEPQVALPGQIRLWALSVGANDSPDDSNSWRRAGPDQMTEIIHQMNLVIDFLQRPVQSSHEIASDDAWSIGPAVEWNIVRLAQVALRRQIEALTNDQQVSTQWTDDLKRRLARLQIQQQMVAGWAKKLLAKKTPSKQFKAR